jgi:Family of unknown function (DUF5677)
MKPNKFIIDRKQDKEIQKILNRMGRLVDEVVNYGSHILDYCTEIRNFNEYEVPVVTCYTQLLSLLDGISILIKKGTSNPIKPLLRSMLELKFYIEYMLINDDKKGVIAYQVSHAQNLINNWKMVDPTTQQGKQFAKNIEGINLDLSVFNPKEKIKELEQMLNREPFKEVNDEWLRTRKKMKRMPNWHALFGGPQKIYDLAEYLEQTEYYAILYKNLSSFIHGSETIGRLKMHSSGLGVNPGIRQLEELPTDLNFSIIFALELYSKMLNKYNPEKEIHFGIWYLNEIRDEFFKLVSINFEVEYVIDKN